MLRSLWGMLYTPPQGICRQYPPLHPDYLVLDVLVDIVVVTLAGVFTVSSMAATNSWTGFSLLLWRFVNCFLYRLILAPLGLDYVSSEQFLNLVHASQLVFIET